MVCRGKRVIHRDQIVEASRSDSISRRERQADRLSRMFDITAQRSLISQASVS
jgi:hypothetical protein